MKIQDRFKQAITYFEISDDSIEQCRRVIVDNASVTSVANHYKISKQSVSRKVNMIKAKMESLSQGIKMETVTLEVDDLVFQDVIKILREQDYEQ